MKCDPTMRGLVNGIGGTVMNRNRPPSFPLAAQAHLSNYRACVYYKGGVFVVDCHAMSKDEADRIGVHYFLKSNRSNRIIERVASEPLSPAIAKATGAQP